MTDVQQHALAELQAGHGPVRFGRVGDHVFRGGQPNAHDLALLHDLGVETIIDLRRGDIDEEAHEAQRLGMHVVRFPFSGLFSVDGAFLSGIVETMKRGGNVYVHCHAGRDRTSLVVAMYRVLAEGWDPQRAWQAEAVAYGHKPGIWYRAISRSFNAAVRVLRPHS